MLSLSTTLFALKNWQNHRVPKKKSGKCQGMAMAYKTTLSGNLFFCIDLPVNITIHIYIYTHTHKTKKCRTCCLWKVMRTNVI
jgi:hypothetical protein